MSCLFQQNTALRAARHGAARGMAYARSPGMSCLFHQNRHSAQRCMARHDRNGGLERADNGREQDHEQDQVQHLAQAIEHAPGDVEESEQG